MEGGGGERRGEKGIKVRSETIILNKSHDKKDSLKLKKIFKTHFMKLEYPNGEPSELVKAGFRKKFRFSLEKVRNRKLANLKNQITRRKTNEDADPPKKRKKCIFLYQ